MWTWRLIRRLVFWISKGPEARRRRFRRLTEQILLELDHLSSSWSLFRSYPKRASASDISVWSGERRAKPPQVAVLVEGPILGENDFTAMTLRLYQQTMPNAALVLSTDKDPDNELWRIVRADDITLVLEPTPINNSAGSLPRRMSRVSRGLEAARALGCEFVLQTSTSSRIHRCDADEFCRNFVEMFPIESQRGQTKRLLSIAAEVRFDAPFRIASDTMFGATRDLMRYWTPIGQRHAEPSSPSWSESSCPDTFLCERYLSSFGVPALEREARWRKILGQHFGLIDAEMIDLFQIKQDHEKEDSNHLDLIHRCDFPKWLDLFLGETTSRSATDGTHPSRRIAG